MKRRTFFYIDECQNVIARDEKIPTILDECRSQKIALIMAHQRTKQITSENVLDALSNCAIRFANSDEEARFLAPRMRSSQHFLQHISRGKFAAFVRDLTPEAVAVSVSKVEFGAFQMLSTSQQDTLAERMRARYGRPRKFATPVSPAGRADEAHEPSTENVTAAHHAESGHPDHRPPSNLVVLPKPATRGGRRDSDAKSEGGSRLGSGAALKNCDRGRARPVAPGRDEPRHTATFDSAAVLH